MHARRSLPQTLAPRRLLAALTWLAALVLPSSPTARAAAPAAVNSESASLRLDTFEVKGERLKSFANDNLDIIRGENDPQAYHIFTSEMIESSGAATIGDYLKQQLTPNTVAQTNDQKIVIGSFNSGNTSTINLRGLGANKTLILIDGRRSAGLYTTDGETQADINGIPVNAIDRIEVLPSSAAGIYGGGAIGGVVNVILKKQYRGGELHATFGNVWQGHGPSRSVSLNYGFTLEGGRTSVLLVANASDSTPLLFGDRADLFRTNLAQVIARSPSLIFSSAVPFLGSLPNVTASSSATTRLTLLDGRQLTARTTFVPAGTSPSTSTANLATGLLANAGTFNLDLPPTGQAPTGLRRPISSAPQNVSYRLNLRRRVTRAVDVYADFSYFKNLSRADVDPLANFTVPIGSPANPFREAVLVRLPNTLLVPYDATSVRKAVNVGLALTLPRSWKGLVDYEYSRSLFENLTGISTPPVVDADLKSGALNPFVDALQSPLALQKYVAQASFRARSSLANANVRFSGPLRGLPMGQPILTFGAEHRLASTPSGNRYVNDYPANPVANNVLEYFPRHQATTAGFGEYSMPLVKENVLPLVHAVTLQLAGRLERFTVDTGTTAITTRPNDPTYLPSYTGPTSNGQPRGTPIFSRTTYTSPSHTLALAYEPVRTVTLRASSSTAFNPPQASQLIRNTLPLPSPVTVTDPLKGTSVSTSVISGGNPDLTPENSRSVNLGLIWQPDWAPLKGWRFNAERYAIEQRDLISTLATDLIVSQFPDRVTRNSAGVITQVDTSLLNLFRARTTGWDLAARYRRETRQGVLTFSGSGTIIQKLRTQYVRTSPDYEAAGFSPVEGGAPKYKSSAMIAWDAKGWSVQWSARHVGRYQQAGAVGGPGYTQSPLIAGIRFGSVLAAQGTSTIPAQLYHNVVAGYTFGARTEPAKASRTTTRRLLSNLSVQVGVRNLFNTVPPFDASYPENFYLSPYGDGRLRSYWLTLRKQF